MIRADLFSKIMRDDAQLLGRYDSWLSGWLSRWLAHVQNQANSRKCFHTSKLLRSLATHRMQDSPFSNKIIDVAFVFWAPGKLPKYMNTYFAVVIPTPCSSSAWIYIAALLPEMRSAVSRCHPNGDDLTHSAAWTGDWMGDALIRPQLRQWMKDRHGNGKGALLVGFSFDSTGQFTPLDDLWLSDWRAMWRQS